MPPGLTVKTCPALPIGNGTKALVAAPYTNAPVASVVSPVPPLDTPKFCVHWGAEPDEVKIYPAPPIPSLVPAPLAPPYSRSPAVVRGDRLLNAVLAVVAPVPPLVIGKAVPDKLSVNVPELVIDDGLTDKNDGTTIPIDVTVPEDPLEAEVICP